MKITPFALVLLSVALVSACSSVRTHYDFDPTTDFSNWGTYAWYPGESPPVGDPKLDNPLLHDRIVTAVERTLAAQGFSRLDDGTPDFYVKTHLSTEQRLSVQTMNTGYRGGPYGRRWGSRGWDGAGWTETTVEQYEEGTLVIDFVDATAQRLVWRGSGTRRLARNPPPDQVTKHVDAAVSEILGQFPPEKK